MKEVHQQFRGTRHMTSGMSNRLYLWTKGNPAAIVVEVMWLARRVNPGADFVGLRHSKKYEGKYEA